MPLAPALLGGRGLVLICLFRGGFVGMISISGVISKKFRVLMIMHVTLT